MPDPDEPITVPYEEPSDEDKARWAHEAELGQLIDAVCGQLKLDVGYVHQSASGVAATADSSTQAEFAALAAQCHDLSGRGQVDRHRGSRARQSLLRAPELHRSDGLADRRRALPIGDGDSYGNRPGSDAALPPARRRLQRRRAPSRG